MTTVERLAQRHRRVEGSVDDFCSTCDQAWPCEAMGAIEELKEEVRAWQTGYEAGKRRMADAVTLLKAGRSVDVMDAINLLQNPT